MRVRSPFPRPQATRCVKMAAARLLLLCRKTRALPAEVLRLVHDYLFVHMANCPVWLNGMLADKERGLPRARNRCNLAEFHVSETIEFHMYRHYDYVRGAIYQPQRIARPGQPVNVDVRMFCRPHYRPQQGLWQLSCWQGDYSARTNNGSWSPGVLSNNFLSELSELRRRFDESEPRGCMEVPVTWRDWRRFIRLYLFGPQARRPMLELQRNPVAGGLCRECGKSSMPDPVHVQGEAFCSQDCARDYTVLSCYRCRVPMVEGQGLCVACADLTGLVPYFHPWATGSHQQG